MKGNVFSQWLREFCALVFTQTVQAFLLSIVLTLVIITLTTDTNYTNVTQNQAAGVLAIIALTSISKMEELIKKLFGLNSSITDTSMKSGTHGMLGTIMAMKMAKNALNNIPKIGSGVKDKMNIRKEMKSAHLGHLQSMQKELSRYNALNGAGGEASASNVNNTNAGNAGSGSSSNVNNVNAGNTGGGSDSTRTSTQFNTGDSPTAGAGSSSNSGTTNAKNNNKALKERYEMEDKLEKMKKEYEDKKAELQKKNREANKKIASGITETGGALIGGTLGAAGKAVWAAGTGDSDILQEAARGLGMGIGVGDKLGQKMVDIPGAVREYNIERKKLNSKISNYKSKVSDLNKSIEQEMRKFNAGDI